MVHGIPWVRLLGGSFWEVPGRLLLAPRWSSWKAYGWPVGKLLGWGSVEEVLVRFVVYSWQPPGRFLVVLSLPRNFHDVDDFRVASSTAITF